ncbi:universal stress protein [Ornithinimicrobium cavernae]|uniref:universal stress protein n=1 Tax=Ornithinimicrobium cavernae TaxID=2666047 RepID=UPI000D689F45|nr:universal stress protein [Ornithinimicrobium cavernae]
MPVAVAHNARPEGRSAVTAALEWARVHDTSLLVLHVEETGLSGTAGVPAAESGVRAVEQEVAQVVAELAGEAAPEWQVVSTTSAGDIASALVQLATTHGAELLVVGSRRRSEIGKFLMGRTLQRVLLDSPVPVLVVKHA